MPLLVHWMAFRYRLTISRVGVYILRSSDIFQFLIFYPNSFQCLIVIYQSTLCGVSFIRSLLVVHCEFGCALWHWNHGGSTGHNRVTSLSLRHGVYVLSTWHFRCMECWVCIRAQPIFFTDLSSGSPPSTLTLLAITVSPALMLRFPWRR